MHKQERNDHRSPEPTSPSEWQEVVNHSYAILILDYAVSQGLLEGARARRSRCLDLLRRGRAKGFLPQEDEVAAALVGVIATGRGGIGVWLGVADKLVPMLYERFFAQEEQQRQESVFFDFTEKY
jgi:hypothetical protein